MYISMLVTVCSYAIDYDVKDNRKLVKAEVFSSPPPPPPPPAQPSIFSSMWVVSSVYDSKGVYPLDEHSVHLCILLKMATCRSKHVGVTCIQYKVCQKLEYIISSYCSLHGRCVILCSSSVTNMQLFLILPLTFWSYTRYIRQISWRTNTHH